MKLKNYIPLFFITVLVLTACSKNSNNTPTPTQKKDTTTTPVTSATPVWETNADVYFVGTTTGEYPNNSTEAAIWKNGVLSLLPNSLSANISEATGVAVIGPDVYVSGNISNKAVL